jgi:hypothetical protein
MTQPKTQRREQEFVPVLLAQDHGETQLKVWCPYCVQFHYHGRGGGEGHRVAHCDPDSCSPFIDTGYIIRKTMPRRASVKLPAREFRGQ